MTSPVRDRFFNALAAVGSRYPGRVLLFAAVYLAAAGSLLPGLGVSTSRYGLVAEDDPVQGRLVRFFERFGYPDSPLIVIEGDDPEMRRRAIDALAPELEKLPVLKDRVLARVGPREAAEVVFLQRPEMLTTFTTSLADGRLPADVIEGGLPSIFETTNSQLNTFAVSMSTQMFMPIRTITPDQAVEVLEGLEALAKAATATVGGRNLWHELLTHNTRSDIKWDGVDSKGYLAGANNEFNTIALFPKLEDDEVVKLEPLILQVREIRDRVLSAGDFPGVSARLTGVPTMAVDEMTVLRESITVTSLATAIGITLLFLIAFRSIQQTILAGMPLLLGIASALALARLLYGELNLVTSGCISLLMGLGIDFSVHTLARYNEVRREGNEPVPAIQGAVRLAGPAIATGAVTTALAFLTTMLVDFTAYSELGVVSAFGLLVMLLAAFLVLPPLIASSRFFHATAAPEVPGIHRLPYIVARTPKVWLVAAGALTVACAVGIFGLRFNARYFDFLPESTESAIALRRLESDKSMSPLFASMTAPGIEQARQLAERVRKLDEVGSVQCASDLLPPMSEETRALLQTFVGQRVPDFNKLANYPAKAEQLVPSLDAIVASIDKVGFSLKISAHGDDSAQRARKAILGFRQALLDQPDGAAAVLKGIQHQLAEVAERAWRTAIDVGKRGEYSPEDLPEIMQVRFASHQRDAVALFVFPSGDPWNAEFTDRFAHALEEIDPETTGFIITTQHHRKIIVKGFTQAALVAAVLVFLMLLFDFRKLGDAALAMLPIGIGWLWMLGIMGGLDITFNVANIVSLPLILGIGIDAGVHIMHRANESARNNQGIARLDELLRGTGGAVLLSSLTTMVGFAGLAFSDYGAMTSLSMAMVIGIGTCLLASLIVLPAVLVLLGRAG